MKPAAQDPAWRCAGRCIPRAWAALAIVAALLALLPLLNLAYSPGHPLHVSSMPSPCWKFMCYALAALALDLVWGYAGILSLGHGLFFALGGYAHGMYLMRAIGRDGAYQSTLPDFMVFLDWKSYPWYWSYTEHFWYAMLLVVLVPGALAFLFGYFAFRSRIKGVYFSIITQALTFAAMLLFFRNDTGFGGNNGFTDFKRILGHDITAPGARALYWCTLAALAGALVLARAVTQSKLGRVLTAVRDSESRLRFIGYEPLGFKLFVWTLSAVLCGIAGALYVPQVGIINPGEMSTENSIEMVIWVATGGRGTLIGPIIGAGAVNGLKTWFTSVLPEFWLYALGLIFVLVTLFLPTGIVGLARRIAARISARITARRDALPPSLPPRPGAQGMNPTHPAPDPLDGGPSGEAGYGRVSSRTGHHPWRHPVPGRRHGQLRRFQGAQRPDAGHRRGRTALHHRSQRRRQDHHDGRDHRQDPARVRQRLLRPEHRSDHAQRNADRACGHRPQVPAAHGVRATHGVREPGAGHARRQARAPLFARLSGAQADRIGETLDLVRLRPGRSARPACCRTARSNGWRSACC